MTLHRYMRPVTQKQREAFGFIRQYIKDRTYPPSMQEVADHFGITVHAARARMIALCNKGYIDWQEGASRTIRILKKGA